MALLYRPFSAQLARDVIAVWLRRSTGLRIAMGDRNEVRPALPYVGFNFPRGRVYTGDQRIIEFAETIGETTITLAAGEGERAAAQLGPALVDLTREVGEALSDFAERWAVEAAWWLRHRAEVAPSGSTVVVTPSAPGLLVHASMIEGGSLTSEVGDPIRRIERLYRCGCRVEVMGAPAGENPGEEGDGLDTYTIEAAIREGLSDPVTKRILRGGWLVPYASPLEVPSYASVLSGARRESRVTFDLALGWTALYVTDSETISDLDLSLSFSQTGIDDPIDLSLTLEPT